MVHATLSRRAVVSGRKLRDFLAETPPWLSSLLFHLSALVLMGLIQTALVESHPATIEVSRADSEGAGDFDLGTSDGGQNGESISPGDGKLVGDVSDQLALLVKTQQAFDPRPVLAGDLNRSLGPSSLEKSDAGGIGDKGIAGGGGKGFAVGGDGKSIGDGDGSKLGLGHTSLFGVGSEGKRFVYVFDRSDSMNYQYYTEEPPNEFGNIPVRAAKAELLASVYELNKKQQFYLIFYNLQPQLCSLYESASRPMYATTETKRLLREAISELRGEGGTNHLAALEMAIRLRPDVIYLMTDGEAKDDLTPAQIEGLTKENRGKAVINVIQFAQIERPKSSLEILAKENRGKHIFIDVTKIGKLARNIKGQIIDQDNPTTDATNK